MKKNPIRINLKRLVMRFSCVRFVAAAFAVVALTSCDAAQVTDPVMVQPPAYAAITDTDGRVYTELEGQLPSERTSASAWIDAKGGWVYLSAQKDGQLKAHGLYVPERVVAKKTLFTITRIPGNQIAVRLDARAQDKKGEWHDVGGNGFRKPVYLFLTYAWSTNVTDESKLIILYDPETDGRQHERTKSGTLPQWDKHVVAELWHFSKYVIAQQ